MIAKPPGISASPACSAVYPSSVCINSGNSSVLAEQRKAQHEHQQVAEVAKASDP